MCQGPFLPCQLRLLILLGCHKGLGSDITFPGIPHPKTGLSDRFAPAANLPPIRDVLLRHRH
jgi:hypothetical protein